MKPLITPHTTLSDTKRIIKSVEKDHGIVNEIIKHFNDADQRIVMRATWTLLHLSFAHPELVEPKFGELLKLLRSPNTHTGAVRNCIRIFTVCNIPERYSAEIFDLCMSYLKNNIMPHAVRAFAINTLCILCNSYPELSQEVKLVLNELKKYPQAPSIQVWLRRADKALTNIKPQ